MMAIANDDSLNRRTKLEKPIIASPPEGISAAVFRDPCVWFEEGEWWMIVGSGIRGIGGCALLYRAKQNTSLTEWEYLHPLVTGVKNSRTWPATAADTVDSGEMWECPDFFPLGNTHCLIYSTERKVFWNSGAYSGQRFMQQHCGLLDHGAFYAPKTFITPDGRRILWGWIQETRPEAELIRAGWAGVMSLPRELSLQADGALRMVPAGEINSLREKRESVTLQPALPCRRLLSSLRREVAVPVLNSSQRLRLEIRHQGKFLWSLEMDGQAGTASCGGIQFKIPLNESPALRLFLDGSVLECFFGNGEALTSRVYGLQPGESELQIVFDGAGTVQCELWNLRSISRDKLTSGFPAL
jgi:beta-fructofuranosidase